MDFHIRVDHVAKACLNNITCFGTVVVTIVMVHCCMERNNRPFKWVNAITAEPRCEWRRQPPAGEGALLEAPPEGKHGGGYPVIIRHVHITIIFVVTINMETTSIQL